jgi:hypothetical protein
MLEYLKENKVTAPVFRVGKKLAFDPKTERFTSDEEANKLLTRDYRKPFVVPEKF